MRPSRALPVHGGAVHRPQAQALSCSAGQSCLCPLPCPAPAGPDLTPEVTMAQGPSTPPRSQHSLGRSHVCTDSREAMHVCVLGGHACVLGDHVCSGSHMYARGEVMCEHVESHVCSGSHMYACGEITRECGGYTCACRRSCVFWEVLCACGQVTCVLWEVMDIHVCQAGQMCLLHASVTAGVGFSPEYGSGDCPASRPSRSTAHTWRLSLGPGPKHRMSMWVAS